MGGWLGDLHRFPEPLARRDRLTDGGHRGGEEVRDQCIIMSVPPGP